MDSKKIENKKGDKIIYPELSYKIVGILFKVHRKLGSGYQEKYYNRALCEEFKKEQLRFQKEIGTDLKYEDLKIGKYVIDFLIEDKIVLEIKAIPVFGRKDFRQVEGYLKATNLKLGILANFCGKKLNYYRVLNNS